MPQTAFDVITSALRLVGVLAAGETPDEPDANDALQVFNDMIDAWNAQRTAIFTTLSQDFPFVAGQQAYTMGPGGNFDTQRPARIDAMSAILLYDASNPVEVPMSLYTVDQWQNDVPVKQVNGNFPQLCYDDGGFPLRTLNMWPIPIDQPNLVRIYSWQALAAQTLTSQVTFPPGYGEGLRYNLAVRLGAEYGVQNISPVVIEMAKLSLATIKSMNAPDLLLQSDLIPQPAGYNYRADLFGIPW